MSDFDADGGQAMVRIERFRRKRIYFNDEIIDDAIVGDEASCSTKGLAVTYD